MDDTIKQILANRLTPDAAERLLLLEMGLAGGHTTTVVSPTESPTALKSGDSVTLSKGTSGNYCPDHIIGKTVTLQQLFAVQVDGCCHYVTADQCTKV